MELQLALDTLNLEDALDMARRVEGEVDIIEIGTPFILEEGMEAVRRFREAFPRLKVLADVKIMDAGKLEAAVAIKAGADIVTVLGAADDVTIGAVVEEAHKQGRQVMVDMICVEMIEERTRFVDGIGADYVCAHTAFDLQDTGKDPLEELLRIQSALTRSRAAVAGGVSASTIGAIVAAKPAIVVVGGGITSQKDPRAAAAALKAAMNT